MNNEEFEKIINTQSELVEKMLLKKGDMYATETDRLHNFRTAAKLQHCTMKQALGGFMAKHTVSIYDMIEDEVRKYSKEIWEEKITDHIAYLLLLKAVIVEEESYEPIIIPKSISVSDDKLDAVASTLRAYEALKRNGGYIEDEGTTQFNK